MMSFKKAVLPVLTALSISLASVSAFAGWGAIACDSAGSGACGAAAGYWSYDSAYNAAINACLAGGYSACTVVTWEHDSCCYTDNGASACY